MSIVIMKEPSESNSVKNIILKTVDLVNGLPPITNIGEGSTCTVIDGSQPMFVYMNDVWELY